MLKAVGAAALWTLAGAWSQARIPDPIRLCEAWNDRVAIAGRIVAVEGVHKRVSTHVAFTSPDCPEVGFGTMLGDIAPDRREALDRYQESFGGLAQVTVEVPIIYVGRLEPSNDRGGWQLVVEDFSVPAPAGGEAP